MESNMEDMYVKPGNQARGWNDPPQLSYGLQRAAGSNRTLLTRRAAPGAPPPASPSYDPLAPPPRGVAPLPPRGVAPLPPRGVAPPPPRGVAPPPLPTGGAPPVSVTTPRPPPSGPIGSRPEGAEPDAQAVLSVLRRALDACRRDVPAQVCNEVEKRLLLLQENWTTGRLSLTVRRRMELLAQEVSVSRWDSADEVHRSLMVDHVTEVSQWLVGVKRLIAEARNLSPELLESVCRPVEPVLGPTEPVLAPTEPVPGPAEPVPDPTEPVLGPTEPVPGPAEPFPDPTELVPDPTELVPSEPIPDPTEPVQHPKF